LSLCTCNWILITDGRLNGGSETKRAANRAVNEIEGRPLTNVTLHPATGETEFIFDRNWRLSTAPEADDDAEQWMVYGSTGDVLTFRADGQYSRHQNDASMAGLVWHELDF
jgi:hypothetical protein